MITGWATNTRYKEVHFFDHKDGMVLCRQKKRNHSSATLPLPKWDPEHPNTCPKCKRLVMMLQGYEIVEQSQQRAQS